MSWRATHSLPLTTRAIARAQLHSEGVSALSAALVENRSLTLLDLSANRVTLEGLRELARALRLNATLATLRLENWQDTFDNEQAGGGDAAARAE